MKFLYSHRTRSADGQYVHIRELTDALARRGHYLDMAGPEGAGARAEKLLSADGGGGLSAMMPRRLYEMAEYGYSIPAYRRLLQRAKAHEPEVLYERYNLFFHAGVWLRKKLGLPFILEVNAPLAQERASHGNLALKKWAQQSERAIWQAADMVLPVTNVLADHVRKAGVAEEKISIIQNGVSDVFLEPHDGAPIRECYQLTDKIVLGFTGFVRDWHGLDRVVRVLSATRNPNVHLLLVGDGPARADLERLANDLGVGERFSVTGVVQRENIPGHIAAFDVALQPAVVDYASPLKLFEYMAMGKAIVAPQSANICEVLGENDAILFTDEDGDFEKALDRLIASEELRQRLGTAARASLLRQDFTWDANARRVEAIAEKLLERKP